MSTSMMATAHPLEDTRTILKEIESTGGNPGAQSTVAETFAVQPVPTPHSSEPKQMNDQDINLHTTPAYLGERSQRKSILSERTRRPSTFSPGHAYTYPPALVHPNSEDHCRHAPVLDHDESPVQITVSEVSSSANLHQERRWKRNSMIQLCALYWTFYLEGWNDGSNGPLLPVVQRNFHIGFAVVALLFVSNCIGFISGAFVNVWMNQRFGFGKVLAIGAIFQLAGYAILAPAPPFPLMVFAYGIAGFGMSLQQAQANGFVASVSDNMSVKLGMLHASYGLGAFSSPFLATHFSTQKHWSFHYLASAGIAATNVAVLLSVFRLKRQEDILAEAGQFPSQEPSQSTTERTRGRTGLYSQILTLKAVHFMALFALIYVGVEVTLGGWIVTFIIEERNGGPSAGFVSSGFFGGLTLGRVGLMWLNKLVGERRIIFIYALLSIAFELTIWLVPSVVENAVAISFIGVLLGPIFPLLVSHATKVLPGWLLTGSIGLITSIGISGSALLPFITGILASKYGIKSLQPFIVSMISLMIIIWALVLKGVRRID